MTALSLDSVATRMLSAALRTVGKSDLMTNGRTIAVFGIGSNNVSQLRTRVNAPDLVGLPTVVHSYERCFGGPNGSWSVGGRLGGSGARCRPPRCAALRARECTASACC